MKTYINRKDATEFLRAIGVELGDATLANLASDGKGPRYTIINGRALYTEGALREWVNNQADMPAGAGGST
jgi:hypothetical protein